MTQAPKRRADPKPMSPWAWAWALASAKKIQIVKERRTGNWHTKRYANCCKRPYCKIRKCLIHLPNLVFRFFQNAFWALLSLLDLWLSHQCPPRCWVKAVRVANPAAWWRSRFWQFFRIRGVGCHLRQIMPCSCGAFSFGREGLLLPINIHTMYIWIHCDLNGSPEKLRPIWKNTAFPLKRRNPFFMMKALS